MKCYRTCQGHAQAFLGWMLSVHFPAQAQPRCEMLQNLQIGLIGVSVNGMSNPPNANNTMWLKAVAAAMKAMKAMRTLKPMRSMKKKRMNKVLRVCLGSGSA